MFRNLAALHAPAAHTLAVHGLAGEPLAWGAIVGALGVVLWHHEHHWQRFTAWCFAVAAGCFTVAIPPLFGALAALTTTGTGLTVLAVVGGITFVTFYLHAIRSGKRSRFSGLLRRKGGGEVSKALTPVSRPNRYRRIGTPIVSIVAGALFVVVVGGWRLLAKNAGTSAAATLKTLATSSAKVNNGSAAASVPPSHRPEVYFAAVVVLLAIAFIMRLVDKRRHGGGKGSPQAQRGKGTAVPQRGAIPLPGGNS
jgi:hypothetical protein